MKQAFLQIRISEKNRNVLRFHWIENMQSEEIKIYRFTRVIFGLGESPFLLNGNVKEHLESSINKYPEQGKTIDEIEKSLYVDDIVTGEVTVEKVKKIKRTLEKVFGQAGIELRKWHKNAKELEETQEEYSSELSYAKQKLGTRATDCKILGIFWDKSKDTCEVDLDITVREQSKRGMLKHLAYIFDQLGLISPATLTGKDMYREACDRKISWDEQLTEPLRTKWIKWSERLPQTFEISRSIPTFQDEVLFVDLHVFGDAILKGASAILYAVVHQKDRRSQRILAAKSRLWKRTLTVPRLELVAVHMATNLMENTRSALKKYPVDFCYTLTDSTVVLCWLKTKHGYKEFVTNRVLKINEKNYIEWGHVPTQQNPANIGNRGCKGNKIYELWTREPSWLDQSKLWPENVEISASEKSEAEKRATREILKAAKQTVELIQHQLLEKHNLKRANRILAWIRRFINNSRVKEKVQRNKRQLSTNETEFELMEMIKIYQTRR